MAMMLLGLAIFFVVHLIPAYPGLKERSVSAVGESGYKGAFSLVSLVGFVLVVWGFGIARENPIDVWYPASWLRHVTMLLMLPVFPLLVMSLLPGQAKKKIAHPMLMAVKTWAFAHLLSNGDLASMLLFGSFLIYGVIGLISAKKRQRSGQLTVSVGPARNDIIALVVGVGVYVAFVLWGHWYLIGVPLVGA